MTVLVNALAGYGQGGGRIGDALRDAGMDATVETVTGGDALRARATRAATRGDALVAAGGDGTVSAVASVAAGHGVPFGVLPLGTLNHFAKDAGLPAETGPAIETLRGGTTRAVDIGEINGRIFLNNASLGIYPRLVWERDAEQQKGRRKWVAFGIALMRVWRRYRTLTVRMRIDGREYIRRTPFVFIGNGRYASEGLRLGARAALDGGVLSVFVAPYCGRFELVRVAFRALAGRLETESKFESFEGRELTIDTARRRVSVALDGEVAIMTPPLTCRVRPAALRLIARSPEP
jgi:diacylglycerol kinase family enzyme